MKISAAEARRYFDHPTQAAPGLPDEFPEDGIEYRAESGVCLIFHPALWPGVWMVHVAVNPAAWGKVDAPARRLLTQFQDEFGPERIVAWVEEQNRACLALTRRLGFTQYGRLGLQAPVVMLEWRA